MAQGIHRVPKVFPAIVGRAIALVVDAVRPVAFLGRAIIIRRPAINRPARVDQGRRAFPQGYHPRATYPE